MLVTLRPPRQALIVAAAKQYNRLEKFPLNRRLDSEVVHGAAAGSKFLKA